VNGFCRFSFFNVVYKISGTFNFLQETFVTTVSLDFEISVKFCVFLYQYCIFINIYKGQKEQVANFESKRARNGLKLQKASLETCFSIQ
jgi:hypothetical protein